MFDSGIIRTIGDTLRARGWQLSVAESVTAGHLQSLLTSISGASDYFVGGVTAYNMAQKVTVLGVDELQARACHGVSAETVLRMARGANRLFRSQVAVATTGYAEPSVAWQVVTPFAFCGVIHGDAVNSALVQRVEVAGQSRQCTQRAVAEFAVSLLARFLASNGGEVSVPSE